MDNTFTPLTPEQYQSARSAGFSSEQIIQNEQKRKSEMVKQTAQPKQSFLSKVGHGALNVLNAIEAPFAGVGAIPVQALAKLTNQPDPFAQGIPGFAGTKVPVTDFNLEKKAGDVAQIGSYFVPGSGVLGAAGMGALQGGGSAMSRGESAGNVALGTGEGALIGGATAGATKLVGAGIRKVGDMLTGESTNKGIKVIKDAYGQALNLSAGERAYESRSGKDLAEILLKHDATLGKYAENGTLDATAAIEKLQSVLEPLNAQAEELLGNPQGVVSSIRMGDIYQGVKSKIQALRIPQAEKNAALSHVEEILRAEAAQYGTELTPQIADQIKQGFWNSVFSKAKLAPPIEKLKGNVSYLTGNVMKEAIEKAVAGTDTEISLKLLNKERGELIDAIKRLSGLDGVRLLRGGKLGNMFGGLVGAMAGGTVGGIPGVIAGDLTGTEVSKFLNNPATKIAIAKGRAKATGLLPSLLGKSAEPVGQGLLKAGNVVSKTARGAGLLGNLLTK